ncbi:MAG: electron transfer flavoprotein-ubiquinone oxidoreductase [Alphaproteobacteria bacterium]|jgi:electron-transferring-flavoprotein dehydrogenase
MSEIQREEMTYDVVIVGAGPAGLSTAIKLKQLNNELSVCLLEKSAEVGAHILSGNVFETKALDELIPNWRELNAPINTKVKSEEFLFLTKEKSFKVPNFLLPQSLQNHNNYIISLSNLCKWLGEFAENLGVEIFPGFAASKLIFNEKGEVSGIQTGDMGLDKDGNPKDNFEPGINIKGKVTVLSEGCRGHLGKEVIKKFNLEANNKSPQQYGIGFKEIWEINSENHQLGKIMHSVGWPLENETYGGSFCYHAENNQLFLGYVIGLDYKNPYLSPYDEFQQFKTHPEIKKLLTGGKRISYGARALIEGGIQSLPQMYMPGALLIGCDAGTLNMPKIKGSHTAMKSGIIAAQVIDKHINDGENLSIYEKEFKNSWVYEELHQARNVKPSFKWGLIPAMIFTGIDQKIFAGKLPFTLQHDHADHESLELAKNSKKIEYPKYDNQFTFDKPSSVYLSGTNHAENQPCHLLLKDSELTTTYTLEEYDEPAQRYCPAGVYEVELNPETNKQYLKINSQNCIHCKTCDIKEPSQNIDWVAPEGGGGPMYSGT